MHRHYTKLLYIIQYIHLFYCYLSINVFLLIQQRIIAKHDIILRIVLNFDSIITEEWITCVDLVLKSYEHLSRKQSGQLTEKLLRFFNNIQYGKKKK